VRTRTVPLLRAAAHGFGLLLGGTAIVWGSLLFPFLWRQVPLARAANQIIAGGPVTRQALLDLAATPTTVENVERCSPTAVRAVALVRLRTLEQTLAAGEYTLLDAQRNAVREAIDRALACSPADSFLWLVLFSVLSSETGFRPEYLACLRLSYQLGPNEGWIAVKRNRTVLAIFEWLPSDIAEKALFEFTQLIESELYNDAIDILLGPGWRLRDTLIARLNGVDAPHREAFAKLLNARGYPISVPGVASPEMRPWR
jgi:hypothetical protein